MPKSSSFHPNNSTSASSLEPHSSSVSSLEGEFYPEYVDISDDRYNYWMRAEHLARYLWARDILFEKSPISILDFACADGYGTKILSPCAKTVTGIDRNPNYLKLAREQHSTSNITYRQQDVNQTPITGHFDAIICFETLEHVKSPENLLQNFHEILEPNGFLLLSVPNSAYEIVEHGHNKDPYHLHIFELPTLLNLFSSASFTVEQTLGQSFTNKIVNHLIPEVKQPDLLTAAQTYAYPNQTDISLSYSYIFILRPTNS